MSRPRVHVEAPNAASLADSKARDTASDATRSEAQDGASLTTWAAAHGAAPGATRAARPISCELTPLEVLGRLLDRRHPMLLDSADTSHPDGRYSILCADPWAILRAKDGATRLEVTVALEAEALAEVPAVLKPGAGADAVAPAPERIDLGHPLGALARIQAALGVAEPPPLGLPFGGGLVGYFAYDLGRDIERLPALTADDLDMDDLCLGLFDWALICDHHVRVSHGSGGGRLPARSGAGAWYLVATARRPDQRSVDAILDEVEAWLAPRLGPAPAAAALPSPHSPHSPRSPGSLDAAPVSRGFTPKAYVAAVRRSIEHIFAGDVYQVCLSQRFDLIAEDEPYALYARLRDRTMAMFSAFLDTPSAHVLSLSPERFLRLRGREVETCPIKGTRPRGQTPDEDAALAAELTASAKDLAELSMIVDLERNDLGRVCEAGTVRVESHAELYTLATVHHTVTRVKGTLRPEVNAAALLAATFPGGSISGAPKIRAMEIIEDLEPTRRGVYTGSVGYVDYAGDLDLNIAIRTAIIQGPRVSVQAGGGIVADSDPQAEYAETLTKARALVEALGARLDE